MDVLVRKVNGQYAVIAASANAAAEPLVLLPPKRLSAAGVIIAKRSGATAAPQHPQHPLARLPAALTRQYMSWLDPVSLCSVAGVSRDCFAAAADDAVWKLIAARLWPVSPPPTAATNTAATSQAPPA